MENLIEALMFLNDEKFAFYLKTAELTEAQRTEIVTARNECQKVDQETYDAFMKGLGFIPNYSRQFDHLSYENLLQHYMCDTSKLPWLRNFYAQHQFGFTELPYLALRDKYEKYLQNTGKVLAILDKS